MIRKMLTVDAGFKPAEICNQYCFVFLFFGTFESFSFFFYCKMCRCAVNGIINLVGLDYK